jgi:hypothetical protein
MGGYDTLRIEVNKHLHECCEEMLTWRSCGTLPDGRIRSIADKLSKEEPDNAEWLMHVERYVYLAAMQKVVSLYPKLPDSLSNYPATCEDLERQKRQRQSKMHR